MDISHRAGIKRQAADAMSRVSTCRTDRTKLDDGIPVRIMTTDMLNTDNTEQEQEAPENYEKPTEQEFNPYHRKLYKLAEQVGEIGTDIPYFHEFIEAQSVDPSCSKAVTSVGKPSSTSTHDTDGVSMRVLPIVSASKRLVPAILRTKFFRLCQYALLPGHLRERHIYDMMFCKFCWLHVANKVYATVRDCRLCARDRQPSNKQRKPRISRPSHY